jgi:hypothetical protein
VGRSYEPLNTFSANDSNTICDVTGFKVKKSQVLRRWEGFYVIDEAWHERQPQDYPVVPEPQKTYVNIRTQSEDTTAADPITPI